MNDSIDIAKEGVTLPEGYFNLTEMLQQLIGRGIPVKVCGTYLVRCGIHENKPLISGAIVAKMPELTEWIMDSDTTTSF